MKFDVNAKRTIAVLALAFGSWTILATSQVHLSLIAGDLHVESDCPGSRAATDVSVTANQITSPAGVSFTDFGFPSAFVDANPNVGTVSGVQRRCIRTVGDDVSSDDWVFTCYDAGAYTCNIYMRSLH